MRSRAVLALFAAAFLGAGCSEPSGPTATDASSPPAPGAKDGGSGAAESDGRGDAEEPAAPAEPGEPEPQPNNDDGAGGEPEGDGSSGGSGDGSGSASAPPTDDRGGVGAMGRALLSKEVPEAVIEIDATPGEALTAQARDALKSRLTSYGQKEPVSIPAGSSLPEQPVYTTAQLRSLMEAHRANYSAPQRVGVYVMVLSGRHEDAGVVGVAFNASSFALFPEQLSGGLLGLNYENFEEAVVVHELGHLFGLVNLTGRGAFHEDPGHKGHSTSDQSVMFWAVESSLVEDVFEGGPPRSFDDDDEAEMAAIRGS